MRFLMPRPRHNSWEPMRRPSAAWLAATPFRLLKSAQTPVVVVTGYPDSALMMEAYQFGPLLLVPKPIDKKMLISAVTPTLAGALVEAAGTGDFR